MIYVCSDVHGCASRFYALLKEIDFKDSDTLYILGDLIDRNEDSIDLLKYVMKQKNIKLLMGNHEEFMYSYLFRLNVLDRLDIKDNFPNDIWLSDNNGGLLTLKQFSKEDLNIKKEILKYLSELSLVKIIKVGTTMFHLSHSGTLPNILEKDDWVLKDVNKIKRQIITWGNPYRDDTYLPISYYPSECICVFGHVPTQRLNNNYSFEFFGNQNTINIDCGCAMFDMEEKGQLKTALGCLCLNTMDEFYIT